MTAEDVKRRLRQEDAHAVVLSSRSTANRAKKILSLIGIDDPVFGNNALKQYDPVQGIYPISDILTRINSDGDTYFIFMMIEEWCHYQIIEQFERNVTNASRCVFLGNGMITRMLTSAMAERGGVIEYDTSFESKLSKWAENLMGEALCWKGAFVDPQPDKPIPFACERIRTFPGCKVLDIGSGPRYKWGSAMEDGTYIPMDPLAYYYNLNYKNSGNPVGGRRETDFGLFEFASDFVKEKVDFVLIDNALDHCIDPLKGLLECLKILKTGGTLSLYSYENESVHALEDGLHKWNLALNTRSELIIWNLDNFVNLNRYLEKFVRFEVVEDERKYFDRLGVRRVFAINMVKQADIPEDYYTGFNGSIAAVLGELMRVFSSTRYCRQLQQFLEP